MTLRFSVWRVQLHSGRSHQGLTIYFNIKRTRAWQWNTPNTQLNDDWTLTQRETPDTSLSVRKWKSPRSDMIDVWSHDDKTKPLCCVDGGLQAAEPSLRDQLHFTPYSSTKPGYIKKLLRQTDPSEKLQTPERCYLMITSVSPFSVQTHKLKSGINIDICTSFDEQGHNFWLEGLFRSQNTVFKQVLG